MICTLTINTPKMDSLPRRSIMLNWAYGKLVTDLVLLCFSLGYVFLVWGYYYFSYLELKLVFGVLSALTITDIVYHSLLISGLRKKRVALLKKFYGYSQFLWMLTPLLGVIYAILYCNGVLFSIYHNNGIDKVNTQLVIMAISLIFQTFVMLLVKREIATMDDDELLNNGDNATNNKKNIFNTEFTLKIENENIEKGNKIDNTEEEMETTHEKAKLTV